MKVIISTKFNSIKTYFTAEHILGLATMCFCIFPLLFIFTTFFFAWIYQIDILSLIRSNPLLTTYFVLFLSFFFCAFATKEIQHLLLNKENQQLIKLMVFLLILTEFFAMNIICGWLLIWFAQKQYGFELLHIDWSDLIKARKKWLLLLPVFSLFIAISMLIFRINMS